MKYSLVKVWGLLGLSVLMLAQCNVRESSKQQKILSSRMPYADVLDIKNVPVAAVDWKHFCFSDLGTWFGLALPDSNQPVSYAAINGPFVMTNGKWWAKSLAQLSLQIDDLVYHPENYQLEALNYIPGISYQNYTVAGCRVEIYQVFTDSLTALVKFNIENISQKSLTLAPIWQGTAFNEAASFMVENNWPVLAGKASADFFNLRFHDSLSVISVAADSSTYNAKGTNIGLEPGKSQQYWLSIGHHHTHKVENPEAAMENNLNRWNHYIEKSTQNTHKYNSLAYRRIAVKSLNTLVNNWRSARGPIYHEGLFPSAAVDYFNGFWAWDSWKHAAAVVMFEPSLAKNQIRAMFDYQNAQGMIADCIYLDSTQNNWLNTKPPLAGWAIWEVFRQTADTAFVKEMLPALERYHRWWYQYRDYNKNGLCEYGSSNQNLEAAKWESGMDNGIRFDSSAMVKIDEGNWAFNQESADLNAYLYLEKNIIAQMYALLGNEPEARQYSSEAERVKMLVNLHMYDTTEGFYFDRNTETGKLVKVYGSEGWTPLFTNLAPQAYAERVIARMTDTAMFASYIPFPTAALSEKEFSTGYWRGPIWLDQTYFAIHSLRNYGYHPQADQFTQQVFSRLEGLQGTAPIRENYWPIDGKGMRVNHFSWSAAHLLMMYHE